MAHGQDSQKGTSESGAATSQVRGAKSHLLEGKSIVVGLSGSIAAVEVVRLIRELLRHGASVTAVMSAEACRIVTPEALHFATGKPPITEITGRVEHVELFGPASTGSTGRDKILLLAPATANTISKIASGISDTPVTTCVSMAVGAGVTILVAPAMHSAMMENPFVAENLTRLKKAGFKIIPPLMEEGEAKLPPPEVLAAHLLHEAATGPWSGREVVVIGGSTTEPIDAVRSLTNSGSGQMAIELATQAFFRGANVSVWIGEHRVPLPPFLDFQRFRTLQELSALAQLEKKILKSAAAIFVPAALSDYTVKGPRKEKIDSRAEERITLTLIRAEKLLPRLRALAPPPTLLVGFKLEPTLKGISEKLLQEHSLDALVANDVSSMGGTQSSVFLVRRGEKPVEFHGPKGQVAAELLDALGASLT